MKKKYIHLALDAAVIAFMVIMIDWLVGMAGDYAMHRMPSYSGQTAKSNFRLNKVDADILVIGSSRGAHHYVTSLLRDSVSSYLGENLTAYNSGIDGEYINSNLCATESVMDRYRPKILIFDVSEWEFADEYAMHNLESLAGNYRNNKFVRMYLDELGWKERVKMRCNMFRFNHKVLEIASSYVKKGNVTGYEPLKETMKVMPKHVEMPHTIGGYSLRNFERVLHTAHNKGVLLIVSSSPSFRSEDGNAQLAAICKKHDTPYIDCYDVAEFNEHPDYFKDAFHLNDKGAHAFTKLFYQRLKPYLCDVMP